MAAKRKTKGPGSDEPFSYSTTLLDDEGNPTVITVPSLSKVEVNDFKLHLLRKKDPTGVLAQDYVLRTSLGDEADDVLEILSELSASESNEFQRKWSEHSGVSTGESKAF